MQAKKQSQLQDVKIALNRLQEALDIEKDEIVRDAVIQRFEFTFELTWKLLQTILKENNIEFKGIKALFRDAAQIGVIDDPKNWFTYLNARNLTTHTYDLQIAEEVYQKAKEFSKELQKLLPKISEY